MSHNLPERPSGDVPPTLSPSEKPAAAADPAPGKPKTPPIEAETLPLAPPSLFVPGAPPPLHGYEILGELGRGGMGVVYKARQLKLNRLVALKMILSGEFAHAEEVRRFQNEAEAVAQLEHPNIIRIYDVTEHDGRPCFAMELADAGSLADRLHGQPLPFREAARLAETLARAMFHAHQRGIVHRDLKPVNVLLSTSGSGTLSDIQVGGPGEVPLAILQPKITDFGLAKRMDSHGRTETGRVIGTVNYMAPEQAEGRTRDIGPQTDIYGLGAILYELLTGRPPFQAESIVATIEMVRNSEPVPVRELNASCPRDLETICHKCLEKDACRRYASAQALADDLARFQAGEPIQARPVSTWERVWRGVQRRRREVIWGSAAALAVLVLGGFLIGQSLVKNRAEQHAREEYLDAVRALEQATELLSKQNSGGNLTHLFEELPRRYEQVQQRSSTEMREQAAHACAALGEALWRAGRKDQASSACDTAARLYAGLLESAPEESALRAALAKVHLRLGEIRADFRDYEGAEREYRAALQDLQQVCKDEPENRSFQRPLAEVHHQLGVLFNTRRKRKEAVKAYQDGLAIRKKLTDAEPKNRQFRRDLARSHGYLGDTYLEMGDTARAWDAYRASEDIRQKLADEDAGDAEARFQLARSYSNEGYYALWINDLERARKAYERALGVQRKLVEDHGEVAEYKGDLGWSLLALAEIKLDANGPVDEVRKLADEARTLFTRLSESSSDSRSYARNLARSLVLLALSQPARDTGQARKLIERGELLLKPRGGEPVEDPDDLYQLAIVETLKAALAGDGREKLTPEEEKRRAADADDAMENLNAAIRRGYTRAARMERKVFAFGLLWKLEPERMKNIVRRCRDASRPASREN